MKLIMQTLKIEFKSIILMAGMLVVTVLVTLFTSGNIQPEIPNGSYTISP